MSLQHRIIYRVGAGKAIGLVFGLLGFVLLPYFIHQPSMFLRLGILFWYPTMGAFVGVFGLFSSHPMLNLSMPWWFRGAFIGAWMNFVLTLFAHEQICTVISAVFGEYGDYISPFSMVVEGALIGLIMDYFLTRWFGDGWGEPESPRQNQ